MADETTQNLAEETPAPAAAETSYASPAEGVASAAPAGGGGGGERMGGRGGDDRPRRRFPRRKVCYFRVTKAEYVDFKDVNILKKFISDSGKILPRRVTGTSAKFQRLVTTAIKRARYMALIPYTSNHR